MTYESDIAKRRHRVGYYVAFDGIPTKLATHDFAALGLEGTFLPVLKGAPRGGPQKLDRRRGLVLPDGFSVEAIATHQVHQLLRRRGGEEAPLAAALAATDTDVELARSDALAEGTVLHLDRETIVLGPYDPNLETYGVYTGCTRGAHGSQATPHRAGAILSTVPRYWRGRRAVLYAVNLETGSSKAVRAGRLSRSPRFRNGTYELTFTDLQRELARPINGGWTPERMEHRTVGPDGEIVCVVRDARAFVDDTPLGAQFVKVSYDDGFDVWHLPAGAVDLVDNTVTLYPVSFRYSTHGTSRLLEAEGDVDLQQVLYLTGDPATLALMLMLSTEGQFDNGPYDLLPGRLAETGVPPRRQGAGIPQEWVDVASWEAAAGGPQIVLFSDEQEVLLDLLVGEVLWHLGGKLVINGEGQIAFLPNRPAVPSSTLTVIDGSNRLVSDVEGDDDESEILSLAVIDCNWDPSERQYKRKVSVHFEDVAPIYGEDLASISIRSRTTWVGAASPSPLVSAPYGDETALTVAFDRYASRTRNGLRRTTIALPWDRHLDAIPGWVFKLTHAQLPDGEGGVGVTERQLEVVSASPDYATGRVAIEAEEMPPGWLVAPVVIADDVVTLSATRWIVWAPLTPSDLWDEDPELDFAVGFPVRVYDASASPPFSASFVAVVEQTGGGGLIVETDSPPPFQPAAGDLVVLENGPNTGETNAAGADVQDHLFLADDDGIIDKGGPTERKESTWA